MSILQTPLVTSWVVFHKAGQEFAAIGQLETAHRYFVEALAIASGFSSQDPRAILTMDALAVVLEGLGEFDRASAMVTKSIKRKHQVFGQVNELILHDLFFLARLYSLRHMYEHAAHIENICATAVTVHSDNVNAASAQEDATIKSLEVSEIETRTISAVSLERAIDSIWLLKIERLINEPIRMHAKSNVSPFRILQSRYAPPA